MVREWWLRPNISPVNTPVTHCVRGRVCLCVWVSAWVSLHNQKKKKEKKLLHLCVVVYVPVHVFMGIPGRGGPCPIVLLNPAETGSLFPAAVHHRPRPSYVTASCTKIHTTTASLNGPTCSRPSVYLFLFILILEMLSTAHVLFFLKPARHSLTDRRTCQVMFQLITGGS